MYELPPKGYLRIYQILGNKKSIPPIPALIPVSKSTWWEGIKSGRFPKPVKICPRVTVWRLDDIRSLLEKESFGFEPLQGKLCKKK